MRDNTNRSIYGFSSPFPLPFPFPFPFPFPNETPRRLPVHELQGVVSQSRLKKIVVYSFPSRVSLPYPTIRELPDAFGFFFFPTKGLLIKHRLDTVPLLLQSIVICYRL